jgi:Rad3-related DNA helicase
VSGGILLFFPSYGLLDIYVKQWESQSLFKMIEVFSKKKVFVESAEQHVFK